MSYVALLARRRDRASRCGSILSYIGARRYFWRAGRMSASSGSRPATPFFFFSSRRRHTRSLCDWSSDVCSSDLAAHRTDHTAIVTLTGWEKRTIAVWSVRCAAIALVAAAEAILLTLVVERV